MKVWGLTGGIASGKSKVLAEFEKLGACVVDTDKIARDIVDPHTSLGKETLALIAQKFGPQLLQKDGGLDRAQLRDLISRDSTLQTGLEAIMHPRILNEIKSFLHASRESGCEWAVIEGTRLVESGFHHQLDGLIYVEAPETQRRARAIHRDKITGDAATLLMSIQNTTLMKEHATYVLVNDGDEKQLRAQVERFYEEQIKS